MLPSSSQHSGQFLTANERIRGSALSRGIPANEKSRGSALVQKIVRTIVHLSLNRNVGQSHYLAAKQLIAEMDGVLNEGESSGVTNQGSA